MGFSALDFDKIYDNGGKEFLETEYKEFQCTPKCTLIGKTFDLGIKVNLEKYKKAFEKKKKDMTDVKLTSTDYKTSPKVLNQDEDIMLAHDI